MRAPAACLQYTVPPSYAPGGRVRRRRFPALPQPDFRQAQLSPVSAASPRTAARRSLKPVASKISWTSTDHVVRWEQVAQPELLSDLEQVLHVVGPLLAPSIADGGEQEVRVAAHALLVEGVAPLREHLDMRTAATVLDLHAAHHLVDDCHAVVARAAALAGVAVVAVPEAVVLEQGDVAVEGAPRGLAGRVLGEASRRAARRADAALDAALEAVFVVVHARILEDALDQLGIAPRGGRERVVRDVRVRIVLGVSHRCAPRGRWERPGRTRARSGRARRG